MDQEDAGTIPIIALTADINGSEASRCREAGMDDCISKPIDPGTLFSRLASEFQTRLT